MTELHHRHFRIGSQGLTLRGMKTFVYRTRLALDDFALVERPPPSLGASSVLVRVDAASLNYRDLAIARGAYGSLPVPLVPLSDAAGEVITTGPAVTRVAVGDRVAASYVPTWRDGPVDERTARGRLGGPLDGVLSSSSSSTRMRSYELRRGGARP